MRVRRAQNAQAQRRSSDEHHTPHMARVPAAADQPVGDAGRSQFHRCGNQPGHAGVEERVQQIHMQRTRKVARQPCQEQIEDVVVGAKTDAQPDHLALPQQIPERCGWWRAFHRARILLDVTPLGVGQFGVLVRLAVYRREQRKVEQAEQAGEREAPAPAETQQQDPDQWRANRQSQLRGRIEHGRGEASLSFRKPMPDCLRACRKSWRLAHAQQKACPEEACNIGRHCCGKRGNAPQKGADPADATYAYPIEDHADGELAHRIRPVVSAGQVAEGDVRNPKRGDEGGMRYRQIHPIEIVDDNAEPQEPGDAPAAARIPLAARSDGAVQSVLPLGLSSSVSRPPHRAPAR